MITTGARRRVAVVLVSLRDDGGAETLIRTLLDEVADEPYDLEIFTLRDVNDLRGAEFVERDVPVHTFPARRLVSPLRFWRLLRRIRSGGFDVIHTNLPAANILGICCGTLLRIPVVATLHNTETKADRHWYQGRLEGVLLRRAAARVIAVGERTAEARRPLLRGTTVHVLHNAVAASAPLEPGERRHLRASVMTDPDRRLLLSVGRLATQKAHDDLLHAFAAVRAERDDVELAIAGRGPRQRELVELTDQLGLGGRVHLLGVRTDVRRLMRAADVFVMSSRWEGLPVALLEAMEAGLPVVSTAVGDVPGVLAGGDGRLVPPADPPAFARAVLAVLAGPVPGAPANERIVAERFSSRAWATTLTGHYEAAIASRPGRRGSGARRQASVDDGEHDGIRAGHPSVDGPGDR